MQRGTCRAVPIAKLAAASWLAISIPRNHRGLAKALVITLRTRSYNYIGSRYIDFMAFASADFFSRSVHSLCAEPIRDGVGDQGPFIQELWTPLFGVTQPIAVQRNEVLRDEFDRAFPVYNGLFS